MKIHSLAATIALCTAGMSGLALADIGPTGHVESDLLAVPGVRSVCATLTPTSDPSVVFKFDIDVSLGGGAATIMPGGTVSGSLCDAANWVVDGGTFTPSSMALYATYWGGQACAYDLAVGGQRNPPPKYKWTGDYCFNSGAFCFGHSTVVSVRPCP